ncbi:MAG: Fic family protein, partial [Bacteroidota bacterium]
MEGNTLTYGETELLLMFGKVSGDHEVRELEEMQAHDAIVKLVREYAADKTRDLTESDIRQWNRTILVKPFWKEAITPDGQATRKLIEPGNYKSSPNSVRLSNGEIFHYASPEETPIKMRDLLDWYRNVTEANKLHPVEIAALLHYKFVRIHPFDDSNGRTARLLMNYVLLKNDYPPVIIKSADKKNYLFALNKADTGDENAFVEYISNQLVWSLEINIKAARGESIEAPDDIDKEISVWKKNLSVKLPPLTKSNNVVIDLFRSTIQTFIQEFLTRAGQLDEIFLEKRIWILYRIGDQGSHDVTSDKNYGLMHLEAKLTQLLQSNGTMPHRVDYIG